MHEISQWSYERIITMKIKPFRVTAPCCSPRPLNNHFQRNNPFVFMWFAEYCEYYYTIIFKWVNNISCTMNIKYNKVYTIQFVPK